WQVIRPLRAMLKGNAHSMVRGELGERLPKRDHPRHETLERLIQRVSAPLAPLRLNHRPGKAAHVFDSEMRRDRDGALHGVARIFGLLRVERVAVVSANRGNPNVPQFRSLTEFVRERLPILLRNSCRAGVKTHPLHRSERQAIRPFQLFDLTRYQYAYPHKVNSRRPQSGKSSAWSQRLFARDIFRQCARKKVSLVNAGPD